MNSKKEIFAASFLAIVLASGLGVVSYSLFAETSVLEKPRTLLDVYTQKGGYGPNEPSGPFTLFEMVYLYAEIRDPLNQPVPDNLVGFEVRSLANMTYRYVGSTNVSGIATASFRIPYPESSIGTWEIYARAEYNDTVMLDTLTFRCKLLGVLDISTQKGGTELGQESPSFMLSETVCLYAEVRDLSNQVVKDQPVTFEVKSPDGNMFLVQTEQTNASGIATIAFDIPLDANFTGLWRVYVSAVYSDAVLFDALVFACESQR